MSKASRATLLLPCLLTGGTEVATLETARALLDLGFNTRVVVYFDEVDAEMRRSFEDAGVEVEELGLARNTGRFSSALLAYCLIRTLARGACDVIWVQYMTPTALPLLVARFFGRRLIAAIHVASGHYTPGGRRRIRWIARSWCSHFICVSQDSARGFFGHRLPARVHVLPNTFRQREIDASSARLWREEFGWPASAVLVGYVGRLSRNKGPDVLLEALALVKTSDADVRAVFVGDGEERRALEARATSLGVAHRVGFAGRLPREHVFGALKGFDMAAVPSREEGFGLSALEAMAVGTPVVASAVDALRQLLVHGESGILCRPEDPTALAENILHLARDREQRRLLGRAARARAIECFGEGSFRATLRELLRPAHEEVVG